MLAALYLLDRAPTARQYDMFSDPFSPFPPFNQGHHDVHAIGPTAPTHVCAGGGSSCQVCPFDSRIILLSLSLSLTFVSASLLFTNRLHDSDRCSVRPVRLGHGYLGELQIEDREDGFSNAVSWL